MNQKTISIRKKLITGGVIGSLVILIALAVGLIYTFSNNRKPEISVDHDDFHSEIGHDVPVLELNQKVDYSGIIITEKINGRTEHIKVTEEMIVSCDDTSTPGKKHLVIRHKHEEITIEFYVMFRVEFIVDGEVVSSQLIDDMAKLEIPTPVKTGHEFVGWSPEVPEVITGNSTFEAIFRDQPKEIPLLSNLNAVYGDKLDKFTLPSNEYGRWVFVDDVTSSVGNVGENTFQVKFVPTNTELKEIQGEVKINVSKKKLEFKNLITSFIYDGEPHKPLYELDVEGLKIEYIGNEQIDVGTYNYMYIIDDENYEGSISGTFEIVKPSNITISVNDIIMNYGDVLPEITYSVKGIEDATILGIEIIVPNYKNVGIYENALSVKVTNENYDVTIIPGSLTIKSISLYDEEDLKNIIDEIKLDLEIINPETNEVKPIAYLDKLGDIRINNSNPNGYYSWKNPEIIFDKVGKHQLIMVFTPFSNNYNVQEFEYEITVEKKKLNIIVLENIYTYTGDEYTIHYQIEDGSYEDLEVIGNKKETNAGTYFTTLVIDDENYQGQVSTKLEIAKATPETDFTKKLEDIYWNSSLKDVKLPENYYWVIPDEVLSEVGTFAFKATYNNGDSNYNVVYGEFNVNVIKQVSTLTSLDKYEFTYSRNDVLTKLEGITKSHEESNIEFYLGETKITELVNAGEYELTIKLPESAHYQETSIKIKVNIAQFVVDSPDSYKATYTNLLSSLALPTSEFGTWSWEHEPTQTVGEVGTNKFNAKFTPINSNYKELMVEVYVIVEQKTATIEVTKSRYTYDGTTHYLEYKVLDGELDITSEVNILGNTGRTNAGNLLCNLVIDNKNYKGNITATLYIDKADPVVEWPVIKDIDWNTILSDVVLPEGFSWESTSSFNPYNEKLSTIGEVTYRALYNMHDENYNIVYQNITFNVIKLNPTVTADTEYNFVYDGTIKTLTNVVPSHDESEVKFVYEKDGLIYENLRNEGTYKVTVILPESDHYNEARFTTVVVIDKAIVDLEPIEYDAIFGQTLGDIKLPENPYGVWSWKDGNETSVGNVGANNFVATFTPTDSNYKEDSKNVIVHVSKKRVTLKVTESTFVYNGNQQSIKYQVLDGINDITELVNILGNISLINAGSRTTKLTISSDSYYSDEISVTLVIEKADYTPTYPTGLKATYGDSLSSVKLTNNNENIDGTWEWKEITSVGNAGTNSFKAVFTPTSSNYNSHEAELNVSVSKKELTISITKDTYTYSNELHKLEYVVTGFVDSVSEVTITGNDGLTNAGSKEFTLVVDDANYTGSVTHTLTIDKARVEAPGSYNATYYDQLGTLILPTSTFGAWVWVEGSTTTIDFVGTEEVEVRFNSTDDNFESYTTKVSLTSVKRLLTFTNIESSFVYDGTDKSVKYKLVGLVDGLTTNEITVNGNSVQNIVGSQELTLVVSNSFYYSEPLKVTLEVTKAIPNITFDKVYEIEWFDGITLSAIKLDANFVWVNPTTSLEVGENQVFDVKYVPVSSNYEIVYGTYEVTVTRITPIITYSGPNSSVYTGNDINLESFISHNNKDLGVVITIKYYELVDEVYQEVSKIHDAGSYKVVVSLPQTAHYNEKEIEFTYVVEKKPSVTNPLDDRTAIYGQQLKDLADFPEVSDGVWTWENPDAYVGNVGENTFIAVFTPNDENVLPSSQDIIVKVNPKEIKFENVLSTFDYTGTEHKVTWSLSETPDGVAVVTTGTISMTDYVEGGKAFTLTITGNSNYYGSYEGTIIINQVNPNYGTIPTFTATYGDTFKNIEISNPENGKWSFNETGPVGETGVYTNIELVFTPNSSNYKVVTIHTTLTVNKADSEIANNLPETLTYTGSDLNIESYFALSHNETALLFNGIAKLEVVDAKTYTVTISANETSNYNSVSTTVVFTVNPATPDTDFSNVYENIPYGTMLGNITLPNGYSWNNPETLLLNVANGQEFDATYTPSNANYHSVTGKFTVNVVKADATVSAENIERTYEREFDVLSLLSITASHSQTNVEFYLGEEQITSLVNAGTYTLTIKLPGNENYNDANTNVIVKINKARVEAPSSFTTTYGTTLSDLSLPISEFGKWTWDQETTTSTGVVGTRSFSATFTSESNNYETYTTSVSVTVNKKVLTIDVIQNEFEYDGKSHEIIYEIIGIVGTDSPLIIGSEKLTDAGSLTFTLTTNASNYSLSQECTLKINPKDTSSDFADEVDVEYSTTIEEVEEEVQKLSTYGTVTLTELTSVYNVRRNAIKTTIGEVGDVKEYLLTFKSNNKNYADFEKVITITIIRITSTLKADSRYEFVYDGSDVLSRLTNVVTNNTESIPKYYINSSEVTSLVNAGTYTVEIVYEESEHYTETSASIEIFIDKATPTPSFNLTYDANWNTKLSGIELPENYYWVDGEIVLETVQDGQEFEVVYDLRDANYYTVEGKVVVNVKKIEGTIIVNDNQTFTYIEGNEGFKVVLSINHNETELTYGYIYNGSENVSAIINAGTYEVTITLPESDHYKQAVVVITVVVKQAEYAPVIPTGLKATYGDSLSQVILTNDGSNKAGTWEWKEITNVGNAGTNSFEAIFTPEDENYLPSEHSLSVEVAKKELTITVNKSTFEYNGEEHKVDYSITGMVNGDVAPNIEDYEGLTDIDSKTVILKILESDNNYYGSISCTLTVTKGRHNVSISDLGTLTSTYYNKPSSIELPENENGRWEFENKDVPFQKVGNVEMTIWFIPNDLTYYEKQEFIINVYVNKLEITANATIPEDLIFNGNNYEYISWFKFNYDNISNVGYSITLNGNPAESVCAAGNYAITVTVEGTDYTTEYENTFEFSVGKASYTPSVIPSGIEATYGDELSEIVINNPLGNKEGIWKVTTVGMINEVRVYNVDITFIPNDTNYTSYSTLLNISVNKKLVTITINKNSFGYNGEVQKVQYTIDGLLEGDQNIEVSGNNGRQYIGSEEVTLAVVSDRYQGSVTTTLTIEASEPITPTLSDSYSIYYGLKLNEMIILESSELGRWEFVSPNTVIDELESRHQVQFIPYDENYLIKTDSVLVKIVQKTSEITKNIPAELVYSGEPFDFASWFSLNHNYSTLNCVLVGDVTEMRNAGTYTIRFSVEGNEYCTSVEDTIDITVLQASYVPSELPSGVTATYGDSASDVRIPELKDNESNTIGTWSIISTDIINETGTMQVGVRFTHTNTNYKTYDDVINIIVSKKQISLTITSHTYPYDGSAKTLEYNINDIIENEVESRIPVVLGNESITNVSESKELTLYIDSDYYELSNSVTHALTITPVAPTITAPVYSGRTYYEREFDIEKDYSTGPTVTFNGAVVDGDYTYPTASDVYYGASQAIVQASGHGYPTSGAITSRFTLQFTPNSSNFIPVSVTFTIDISPVALNGDYYYGTIEKALEDAGTSSNAGTTVKVIVGTNPVIRDNATINSGIMLYIPYDMAVGAKGEIGEGKKEQSPDETRGLLVGTLTNTVTIESGVILENKGTIEIGGILDGGGGESKHAGQTIDLWAQIELKDNAQIHLTTAESRIYVYGYIKESNPNNGSKVIIEKGEIRMPFVLRDFMGGSAMYAVYDSMSTYHTAAFNQFEFRNVTSILEINYGGSMAGWANLYAGDKNNYTLSGVIGNTTDYIIQLTDSKYSKVVAKYDEKTEICDLNIYGGARTNSLSLSINVLGTVNIDTKNVYFPISWRYHITLNNSMTTCQNHLDDDDDKVCDTCGESVVAYYSIDQKFKLMTGSVLRVNQGAILSVSELIAYSSYDPSTSSMPIHAESKYPSNLPAAQIIVNGELKANIIAGIIFSEVTGAKLTVTGATNITAYEAKLHSGSSILANMKEWFTINESLRLVKYNEGSNPKKATVGTYYSRNGAWYSDVCEITYNPMGGTLTGDSSEGGGAGYEVGTNGYTINAINTTDPTKEHYIFKGWYLDEECTIPAIGSTIYSSTYVYAKWEGVPYQIVYEIDNETNDTITYAHPNTEITFDTYLPELKIPSLTNSAGENYVFAGWYIDSERTIRVSDLRASDYEDQIKANGTIKLYGVWMPVDTKTYILSFETNDPSISYNEQIVLSTDPTEYSIPNFETGNTDNFKPMYFVGWYTTPDFVEGSLFETGTEITSNLTLYAKWENKLIMTIYYTDLIFTTLYYPKGTVILPGNIPTELKNVITGIEIDTDETAVYFTDKNRNSADFYTGGKPYVFEQDMMLYVDFYYVVDNINDSVISKLDDHQNVLLYKLDFSNENVTTQIKWTQEMLSASATDNSSISNFARKLFTKLLLEDCTGIHGKSGTSTTLTETKGGWMFGAGKITVTVYNGLFANCDSLITVIVKGDNQLKDHMFANCDSLTTVITKDGQVSDISNLIPKNSGA